MFPTWTWIVGFWIGAAVGSFLNVVIYRLPRGLSVGKPTYSFCPTCERRLSPLELVPILSWVFQGGKCRQCKTKISPRYLLVELINGTLWAAIWYQQLIVSGDDIAAAAQADPVRAIAYMLFASALVAAIFTDIAHYIIPDQVNAFMFVVGVGMNIAYIVMGHTGLEAYLWGVPSSLAGAFVGWAVLWGIAFLGRIAFRKDAMGHGDIKMARGFGAVLLPMGTGITIAVAVVLGSVIGVGIALLRGGRSKESDDRLLPTSEMSANGPVRGEEGSITPEEVAKEEFYEPESIGSLIKCGLGYLLLIDIVGLFIPKLYERWFGEDPYAIEEFEEEPEVELTQIPFGPYLAAGALGVVLFGPQLYGLVERYLAQFSGA